jgi:hypothetical protein
MKAFFGLMILMGLKKLPSYRLYWATNDMFGVPAVKERWTRLRYEMLVRYFHVSDNRSAHCNNTLCRDTDHDKLHKLRPFITMLKANLQAAWRIGDSAVDEVICSFKGQTRMKANIKTKKHKWGIKIWKACDAITGYMWSFQIYTGADGDNQFRRAVLPDDEGVPWKIGERVVLSFAAHMPKDSVMFIDNYFTTVRLLLVLLALGIYATGTINVWTAGFPAALLCSWNTVKKAARGTFDWVMSVPGVMVLIWNDNGPTASPKKCVAFASTAVGPGCDQTTQRWVRRVPEPFTVDQPNVAKEYNAGYGGVDRNNRGAAVYKISRTTPKWWAVFWHLIDSTIHSAWVLKYPDGAGNDPKKQQLRFRMDLVEQLMADFSCRQYRGRAPVDALVGHFPRTAATQGRCACGCGKRPMIPCTGCCVHLAINCFENYEHKTAQRRRSTRG